MTTLNEEVINVPTDNWLEQQLRRSEEALRRARRDVEVCEGTVAWLLSIKEKRNGRSGQRTGN